MKRRDFERHLRAHGCRAIGEARAKSAGEGLVVRGPRCRVTARSHTYLRGRSAAGLTSPHRTAAVETPHRFAVCVVSPLRTTRTDSESRRASRQRTWGKPCGKSTVGRKLGGELVRGWAWLTRPGACQNTPNFRPP